VQLDLASLRLLTLVADLGSISAAARAEQISQPSASKRIQVLERQLRLPLLDRRTGGAMLTEQGRVVTDWCRVVVDAADALTIGARALSEASDDQLSIAASQTVAEYLCPSWLNEYRRRGERPAVRLRVANSQGRHRGSAQSGGRARAHRDARRAQRSEQPPRVLSELAVAGEARDGCLVEVPLPDVDLGRFLHAVWRRGSRLQTAARDFLGIIGPRTPAQSGRR